MKKHVITLLATAALAGAFFTTSNIVNANSTTTASSVQTTTPTNTLEALKANLDKAKAALTAAKEKEKATKVVDYKAYLDYRDAETNFKSDPTALNKQKLKDAAKQWDVAHAEAVKAEKAFEKAAINAAKAQEAYDNAILPSTTKKITATIKSNKLYINGKRASAKTLTNYLKKGTKINIKGKYNRKTSKFVNAYDAKGRKITRHVDLKKYSKVLGFKLIKDKLYVKLTKNIYVRYSDIF